MAIAADKTQTLKAFISYSRRDKGITDALVDRLQGHGIDVVIDRRDLPYGEEFQAELAEFIRTADTVIWLVSPESVRSQWCNWELGEVTRLKKRLIPVLIREVALDALPEAIGKIQLLPAEGVFSLDAHTQALVETLNTDRAWLKEHTRLADRARHWIARERSSALLLRGLALHDAETWTDRTPKTAPPASEEILDLILSSRRAAMRRQGTWVAGAALAAVVGFGLAGVAYWQRDIALRQEQIARENERVALESQAAERAAREAEAESRRLAEANERLAREQQQLAEARAFEARLKGQAAEARVMLPTDALAGLKRSAETLKENLESGREVMSEVYASMFDALQTGRQIRQIETQSGVSFTIVSSMAATPDERLIAVGTADLIYILDRDGRQVAPPIGSPEGRHSSTNQLAWDEPGELLAVASGQIIRGRAFNSALRLYDRQGRLVRSLVDKHKVPIVSLSFVPKQRVLLAGDAEGNMIRADMDSGNVQIVPSGYTGAVNGMAWTSKGLSLAVGPARDISGNPRDPDRNSDQSDAAAAPATVEPPKATDDATATALKQVAGIIDNERVGSIPDSAARGLLCVAGSDRKSIVATCGADGNVNIWDTWDETEHHKLARSLRGHIGPVHAVALHPKANVIATGGADGDIRLWSISGTALGPPLRAHAGTASRGVRALLFVKDGKELWSAGNDGKLTVWDTSDLDGDERNVEGSPDFVAPVDQGRAFLSARNEYEDKWQIDLTTDAGTPAQHKQVLYGPGTGEIVDFTADAAGTKVAWTIRKTVTVGDAREQREYFRHEVEENYAARVAFGQGGRLLLVASGAKPGRYLRNEEKAEESDKKQLKFKFLDGHSGRAIAAATAPHSGESVELAGNPSTAGAAFISAGSEGTLRFWSEDGAPVGEPIRLDARRDKIDLKAIQYAPDGKLAAVAWSEGSGNEATSQYMLIDTVRFVPFAPLQRIAGEIESIAFNPAADMLAIATSAGDPHAIHLRSLRGEPLGTIAVAHETTIRSLAFDQAGEILTSIDSSGNLRSWQLGPRKWLQQATARIERFELNERVEDLLKAAVEATDNKDWQKAAALLEEARALDPEHASVRVRLGNAYMGPTPEQRKKALAEYDKAIELAPYGPVNHLQRGKFWYWNGDYEKSAADFTEGLKYDHLYLRAVIIIADFIPINVQVSLWSWVSAAYGMLWFNQLRGRAHLAARQWDQAEADFTLSLEGSPKLRAAQAHALEVSEIIGEHEEVEKWRKALSQRAGEISAEIHELRGRARTELKKFDEAIADLRIAITLLHDPEKPYGYDEAFVGAMKEPDLRSRKIAELHGRLASIYDARGEPGAAKAERMQAIAALDQAHKHAPNDPLILTERGRAKLDAGLPKGEVLTDFVAATEVDPANAIAPDRLVQILIWYRDFERAYGETLRLLPRFPQPTASLKARRAIAAWQIGRREEARQDLAQLKLQYADLPGELARSQVPLWPPEEDLLRAIDAATPGIR